MKVEKISYNLTNTAAATRRTAQPQFTGNPISTEALAKEIDKIMPRPIQIIKKLKASMGEAQDIIINAIGTGCVAPIFIKYNPLSKSDDDTKTYSAMRQPISAILAILTQAGVTIPYNMWQSKKFNNGSLGIEHSQTLFQEKDYIKSILKKLNPEDSETRLNQRVEAHMKLQENQLKEMIRKNQIAQKIKDGGKDKIVEMKESDFNALSNEAMDKMIKEASEEKQRCLTEKRTAKIERGEFYRNNSDKTRELVQKIENELNTKKSPKDIQKYLKNLKKELKTNKQDTHLINLVDEIYNYGMSRSEDCVVGVKEKVKNVLNDIKEFSGLKSKEEVVANIEAKTGKRVKEIDDYLNFLGGLKENFNKKKITIGEIETLIEKAVRKLEKDGLNTERLNDIKLSDKIADLFKSKIKNNIAGYKRISNLVVALAMLPVTCCLLNWVYPRLMDVLFPNLSNKKHSNVAHDYVEKASHKQEVKS